MVDISFNKKETEKIIQAVKFYKIYKHLILTAEEIDPHHKTHHQILLELRNALDHFMRILANKVGENDEEKSADYNWKHLDKAFAHLYRAGYNVLDWLSITYRELISKDLRFYSNKAIEKVIPDYYTKIKPKIQDISYQIAECRENKDIDDDKHLNEDAFENFMKYFNIVSEVEELYKKTIRGKISSLKEFRRKSIFISLGKYSLTLIIGFIIGKLS